MRARISMTLLVAVLAAPAWAQPGYVPLEQRLGAARLAEIGLTARQVQQLDSLLQQTMTGQVVAQPGADRPATGPMPVPPPMHVGLDEGPVKARASGRITGWEPGTLFTLDNGQQWQVMKGRMTLRTPVQDPQVEVAPGIAGRWFLQVDPDLPRARVFRVR